VGGLEGLRGAYLKKGKGGITDHTEKKGGTWQKSCREGRYRVALWELRKKAYANKSKRAGAEFSGVKGQLEIGCPERPIEKNFVGKRLNRGSHAGPTVFERCQA